MLIDEFQYADEIERTARNMVDEAREEGESYDELMDRVSGAGDHEWIIYYGFNTSVLHWSDNAEYAIDNGLLDITPGTTNYLDVIMNMAAAAFTEDVRAKVLELWEAREIEE